MNDLNSGVKVLWVTSFNLCLSSFSMLLLKKRKRKRKKDSDAQET